MLKRLLLLGASCAALSAAPAQAQFIISEFMADNVTSTTMDEDTSRSDWLEIQNVGETTASLNGWYLTDDASNLRKWQFPVTSPALNLAPGARLLVWCSDKNRKASATKLHTNFKLGADGEYLGLIKPDGVTVGHHYSPAFPPQFANGVYGTNRTTTPTVYLPEGSPGKAKVPADATDFANNFTGWNSSVSFNDSGWQSANGGFGFAVTGDSEETIFRNNIAAPNGNIPGDLGGYLTMPNNAAFIRYKFNLPSLANVAGVRLSVKYDDGYVAYLNGTFVDSRGASTPPQWNGTATFERGDSSAGSFLVFSSASATSALQVGDNVLAFYLVNSTTTDAGALLSPKLELDVATGFEAGYLSSATPNAANSAIKTTIGPSISDTTDRPAQPVGGAGSAPLIITTKITKTLRNVSIVRMKYRRMYENETSATMADNGVAPDAVAGDGIYTGQIPTTALTPGQMIRWRVEASDSNGVFSYDPPYADFGTGVVSQNPPPYSTIEDEMYFGTIAIPVLEGSTQLPVLHWFVNSSDVGNLANSMGAHCSFFFQPLSKDNPGPNYTPPKARFYDNVMVNGHGQSSSTFPKNSHDMGFAKGNKFIWKDGEPDSSGVNLLSNYADKSKIRNTLAWDAWAKSGHPTSHYSVLLRVQRNAAFQGLYDLVENANAAWLKRAGFNSGDALYKMYNEVENLTITTNNAGGFEKKNPDNTDLADMTVLVNGLNTSNSLAVRLRFLYDNVDVESLINFMAMHHIILNRDFGHKNYYLYRDSYGTGEWMPLPWDQDLSFGHTWNSGPGYFDDDIHSQGPLQAAAGGNRLMLMVYQTPELNAMYVRRLRTLAEAFFGSATETNGMFVQKANAMLDLIDPNPNNAAAGTDDADLEMRKWGFWVDGASTNIGYTDSRMPDHTVRAQGARITSSNPHPPYPGSNPYPGWQDNTTSLPAFVPGRRDFFFNPTPPTSSGVPLPPTQIASPSLFLEAFDPNPAAGTQDQEYFVLRNASPSSIDISGWKLTGDVEMTFRGGTVLLPSTASVTSGSTGGGYINQIVIANKPAGFRARSVSPKGNEFRFVVGPYNHQLSARGGSVTLSKPVNPIDPSQGYITVLTQAYNGTPTASQNFLRITELNYRPAPPTAGELALVPGAVAGDFEFIEFTNTGPNTLNLGGAYFDSGISFAFPAGYTLASGQRCIVVASQVAFEARYGTGLPVLGNWEGALDNAGERIRIVDSVGEEVLDFTYDGAWFPLPSGQYRSLVVKSATPSHTSYGTATSWALSTTQNGTPNTADTGGYSNVYEGWRLNHFTNAELPTQSQPGLPAALVQDPDGDGLSNFMEYCFGRQPKTKDNTTPLTTPGKINVGGSDYLTVTFVRVRNAVDVTYQVEASTDLANPNSWTNVGILVSATDLGNGLEQVTYRDNTAIGMGARSLHVRAFKP